MESHIESIGNMFFVICEGDRLDMWFWWFILICDCIIPVLMIIAGRMMWKHCPKKINGIVGYRTKMSMKIWIHGNLHMTMQENSGGKLVLVC